jgi:hypothetical protein
MVGIYVRSLPILFFAKWLMQALYALLLSMWRSVNEYFEISMLEIVTVDK